MSSEITKTTLINESLNRRDGLLYLDRALADNVYISNSSSLNESVNVGYNSIAINDTLDLYHPGGGDSPSSGTMSFFATYYATERITIESVLAVLAIAFNAISLGCITTGNRFRFSVYHTLFLNLVVANILSSILSWISNNAMFLFEDALMRLTMQGKFCTALIYLTGAVFVQSSFGIISTLTLLGFSTAQYFAICKPLHHTSIVRKKKVVIFMVTSWIIALVVCSLTYGTLIIISYQKICNAEFINSIYALVNIGACIAIGICGLIFIAILAFFIRIHIEIKQLQKRLSEIRFNQEVKGEKKAFVTTVILMITLVVVFVPYTVVYLVSLNHQGTDMDDSLLIYYMNLLPYVKFISDPIIYGFRMRDIRKLCIQMLLCCHCPGASKLQHLLPAGMAHHSSGAGGAGGYSLQMRASSRGQPLMVNGQRKGCSFTSSAAVTASTSCGGANRYV